MCFSVRGMSITKHRRARNLTLDQWNVLKNVAMLWFQDELCETSFVQKQENKYKNVFIIQVK